MNGYKKKKKNRGNRISEIFRTHLDYNKLNLKKKNCQVSKSKFAHFKTLNFDEKSNQIKMLIKSPKLKLIFCNYFHVIIL